MKDNKETNNGLNRRDFLKLGGVSAALGAAVVVSPDSEAAATTAETAVTRTHSSFPVEIKSTYKRFPQKNTGFCRAFDGSSPELNKALRDFINPKFQDKPGMTMLDRMLVDASWTINDMLTPGSQFGIPNTPGYTMEGEVNPTQYAFANKKEAAHAIKRSAQALGADLVGITPYDERWVYSSFYNPLSKEEIPAELPFKPKSVIVMAIEMDYDCLTTAPSYLSGVSIGKGYSQMTFVAASLANLVRKIGYNAIGCGNDIAQSVPLAIAAGLGEAGRNGMLVTYKYGPRVRICKVFTDLELAYDAPKTFGVREFCEACKRCAEACPSKAIPLDEKPSFEGVNISSNPGVYKWYVDAEKCFKYWGESGTDCATCISVCPFNKPDFWHHRMIAALTGIPGKPVHAGMTKMDKIFGYGNTFDDKAARDWWRRDK